MKSFSILTLAAFGLLLTGGVMAQETAEPTAMPMMADEMMSPEQMMRGVPQMDAGAAPEPMLYDAMMPMHEDCPMAGKMFGERNGGCEMGGDDCPMAKLWDNHHERGFEDGGILFGLLHGLYMLIGLFLAAFVVRRGWVLGEKCPFKCCFSKRKCCSGGECKTKK